MKMYVIYCIKGFDCVVDNKQFHPIRAMVGEVVKTGSSFKCVGIKLIKCSVDFTADTNKPCNIFFDENGRAIEVRYVNA